MLRTHTSTLFPYTTLFRSTRTPCGPSRHGRARRACGGRVDRKSTRLNSSHSQISYAVFCLKKKKRYSHDLKKYVGRCVERTHKSTHSLILTSLSHMPSPPF